MKKLMLVLGLALLPACSQAEGLIPFGDKIGNGGGLWACMKNGVLEKAELVDLFEARAEFQLNVPEPRGLSPAEIYEARKLWIRENLPWLHTKLAFYFDYVSRHHKIADGTLVPVDDSLYRLLPKSEDCAGGEWKYRQFANFTPLGHIIIEKALWESPVVRPIDKGALLVHEAVYFWLRREHGESDSARARHITAILLSDLDKKSMRDRLAFALEGMNPPFVVPDPADGVDDASGFFLKMVNEGARGILHRADSRYGEEVGTRDMTTPCKIDPSAAGQDRDILCLLEMEELDLYFTDLAVQFHVPSNLCSYLRFSPPAFYAYQAGRGPDRVEYEVLSNGTISDKLNSRNGVPTCIHNHSDRGGPNCCEGSYTLGITTYNADGSFTRSETTGLSWGGRASSCLAGPATTDAWSHYRDSKGFPRPQLQYVEGSGFNSVFTIDAAIRNRLGEQEARSNVWTANFYQPSQHLEGKPLAFRKPLSMPESPAMEDSYHWECLSRSEDVVARIRLMIREWNSGPILEGGNPDEGANSRLDWLDFSETFPGTFL